MSIAELKERQTKGEVEAFIKGNMNAWDEIISKEITLHQPSFPDIKGLQAYKNTMSSSFQGFSEMRFKQDEMIGEGETTAVRVSYTMKHTGVNPMFPVPPTGKEVTLKGCLFSKWRDGKIIEQYEYVDLLGFLQQLGVVPAMEQKT